MSMLLNQQFLSDYMPEGGLIGFWDFANGSGQQVSCVHGNQHECNMMLGSTTGSDINDPTWGNGYLQFSTNDDCFLNPLVGLKVINDWTMVFTAQYSGYGTIISLASPTSSTKSFSVYISSGKIYAHLLEGAINRSSPGLTVNTSKYETFIAKKIGNVISIRTMKGGESTTMDGTGITNYSTALGVGFLARSDKDDFVLSMKAAALALFNRVLSIEEDEIIYRYLKTYKQQRNGVNIND